MPARTLTTIDLTNRFYCNVDIDSEVAMKLLTAAIKKAMAEHTLHNLKVKFDPSEYRETVDAIKYVFGVAREQGLLNDRFLFAAASDGYNDVLLTGKFQAELSHAICEEFNITPETPAWWMKWFSDEAVVRFYLPQGPENQRLSIEKLLKFIEATIGAGEKKNKMTRKEILEEDAHVGGKFNNQAAFMEGMDNFSIGIGLPKDLNTKFSK